ncbi:PAS domain-containing sensor histidine kinase [Amylibacter sp. SFDW26]|uniref:sensor histidine kinase NtrY-like n=1 Tax=Amylibacter sp. SFDW26 TaxID=2652722 RepID=UPI001D016417|nr:PAS domain-containing sensor histidine kinase [Amylibacter sp. SFDW26]
MNRLNIWRKRRNVQSALTLCLVALGPILLVTTVFLLNRFGSQISPGLFRGIVLADFVYVLVIVALVAQRIMQMVAARRAKSAGSRLHIRLSGVFAAVAFIPTVLVAVFATITLNIGIEGWFSERVRDAVGTSLSAAEAYEAEQRDDLLEDAAFLGQYLVNQKRRFPLIETAGIRDVMIQGQSLVQRGLKEAYVINSNSEIVARGDRSYLFDYEPPILEEITTADDFKTVIIRDWENNEFRALLKLPNFLDHYLLVSRTVDGDILTLLDETKETVSLYNQLESDRGRLLFDLGLMYLGFAFFVILSAIWLGLWFAERLARPVGKLAGAAQRVGAGDLTVRVREEAGDDEIAMLGRIFNRMTQQVKRQRDDLIDVNERTENRRRLFDSVLTGVSTGVIGLTPSGEIEVFNAAASRLLEVDVEKVIGKTLKKTVPEFAALFKESQDKGGQTRQDEISLTRAGHAEVLLVRIAARMTDGETLEGYVVTFDDVTDLVSAQRMAAWGDVARRIAHEIKNPLTPIQLSAERMRRKFMPLVGDQSDTLEQYTDVIIRQTTDLRRIVDEFSKFARMPEPERRTHNLSKLIGDAVLLHQNARQDIEIKLKNNRKQLDVDLDDTMISQALTNLIKNAGEAIDSYISQHGNENYIPEIRVLVDTKDKVTTILIQDNGIGLPKEKRSRLFEPYVTNRENGTGLGLPIVKKIIEEHGGTLELLDAPKFKGNKHVGAMARIVLSVVNQEEQEPEKAKVA